MISIRKVENKLGWEEIKSAVSPKVYKFLEAMLQGDYEVRAKGPTKGHYTLSSKKAGGGNLGLVVEGPDRVRVFKISSPGYNQVLVREDGLFLEYLPRLSQALEREGYKKVPVAQVFSQNASPQLARVRAALLKFGLTPGKGGESIPIHTYPKSPVAFVLWGVLRGQPIPGNYVYYGYLPSGLDLFLVHEGPVGQVALVHLFSPMDGRSPKAMFLESFEKELPNMFYLKYLLSLEE